MKSSLFWDIRRAVLCLPPASTLVSCSVYSSTLKIEEIYSSETSVDFQRTTRRYIPEYKCPSVTFCLSYFFLSVPITSLNLYVTELCFIKKR
jgi:hypothetical protein